MSTILPIFTVVLSGVVAAFVAAVLSVSKDEIVFRQKKAEELYLAVDRWTKHVSGIFLSHYPYLKGQISKNDLNDLTIKSDERTPNIGERHSQMIMLTRFYFPALVKGLQDLDAARSKVIDAIAAFERKRGGLKEFREAEVGFEVASDRFKEQIVAEGQKYSEIEIFGEAKDRIKRALATLRS